MDKLKDCPHVLLQKLLFTVLIGTACLLVGIAYFLFAHDTVFLALSGVVFASSLLRCLELYRIITQKRYESVEGVCVGIAAKPMRRYRKVRLMDRDGVETSVLLGKQTKVKIGYEYRFYFKEDKRPSLGSEYLDTALSSDHFLGFDELGQFSFQKGTSD